ncbi:MAG: LD-carboxypeptidase [Cyclobacteriaceae bacterium]|nr:LD-carboxypeptidase [Cyclobacteriaceae bacterium]
MDRRKFLIASSLTVGTILAPKASSAKLSVDSNEPLLPIKPQRLTKGDTIGLIAPSSGIGRLSFEKAIANIERLGFKPHYTKNLRVNKSFLGGTDQQRVDDIHYMFSNTNVKGILCIRGGYGSNRLLPLIDYNIISANPKVFIGYSDITALLYGIYSQTGLVCFHGPVGISSFKEFAANIFTKEIMKAQKQIIIKRPKNWQKKTDIAYTELKINPATVQGELVGGNLSVLVALIGTPYDIDFSNKIVFLEEIGEKPYKIDRMLTQLLQSGKLAKAKGLALGVFKACDYTPEDEFYDMSLSLQEVLKDRLSDLQIPVIYGLPFGHISDNATLPFGIKAELDVGKSRLTIIESAVL